MGDRIKAFSRSFWGQALWVALGIALLGFGLVTYRVLRTLHPPREAAGSLDFASVSLSVEEVAFKSVDGVPLAGWWIEAQPGAPAIILCHDVGETRASLLNVAIALRDSGFNSLAIDFRGHGDSGGGGSTLGIEEKRDVAGAVEWLESRGSAGASPAIGVYGVGMGAHAAVLAAADRPHLRVLVLDALYPDAGFPLSRRVFDGWPAVVRRLDPVPRGIFRVVSGAHAEDQRAADAIGRLPGRHLLLLAPAGDAALTDAMKRMYESIPEQVDADGNLVVLPATQGGALYGDHLDRYHRHIAEFFRARLG